MTRNPCAREHKTLACLRGDEAIRLRDSWGGLCLANLALAAIRLLNSECMAQYQAIPLRREWLAAR